MLIDNIKKLCAVSTVTLVAATAFVHADAYAPVISPGMGSGCCYTNQDCPEIHPRHEGCGNWFGEIDALYWRASECGLGFAEETIFRPAFDEVGPSDFTKIYNPRFRWDWGIRVGLGFAFDCGWDAGLFWTHFDTTARRLITASPLLTTSTSLRPLWGTVNDSFFDITSIACKWRLHLDIADLELGRDFCIGGCVSMRPFVGVRALWTNQRYRILSLAPGAGSFVNSSEVELKSEFSGAGLRGGFDTEWHLGCGFSLYGTAAASVVYGQAKSHIFENQSETTSEFGTVLTEHLQRDSWQGCRAITDLALGLRYRQFFCCDTVALTLAVAWEDHLIFNENRFENFVRRFGDSDVDVQSPQFNRGDLCLQGWTFSARVEF